jgi:hypothetical protein
MQSGARRWRRVFELALAVGLLLGACPAPSVLWTVNASRETSVGLKNASSHFLTFYIDGVNRGGVPSGERSMDFIINPGGHILRADATIGGQNVSASRTATVPAGYALTWTVTDPPLKIGDPDQLSKELAESFDVLEMRLKVKTCRRYEHTG